MQMSKTHSVPPPTVTGAGPNGGLADAEGLCVGAGAPTVGPTVGGVGPDGAFGGAAGATFGGEAGAGAGLRPAVERATGSGCELAFAVGLGVSVGLTGVACERTLTVRGVVTVGAVITAGVVLDDGAVITAGVVLDDGDGFTACPCRFACGVGVGVALPGIAKMYGAPAGSVPVELPSPLRPDRLRANAVNATTTTANAVRTSVERRGQLTS